MLTREKVDVVVIGGGVAGLAAAEEIATHGKRVILLEARERVGGRIHTERPFGWSGPIELGAEFVHGGNPALWGWIESAGLATELVPEKQWLWSGGKLTPADDLWGRIDRVMETIDAEKEPTTSFEDQLRQHRDLPERDRILAKNYVEGFQAAPAERMSAAALAGSDGSDPQFRLAQGYGGLISALVERAQGAGVDIRLDSPVTKMKWRSGSVTVYAERADPIVARAAVVTLPLGVWRAPQGQKGALVFEPDLAEKRAVVANWPMGEATRIVLRLRDEFWRLGPLPRPLQGADGGLFGFVHAPDLPIPVWWAHGSAPLIVGWAGGPAASRLNASDESIVVEQAFSSLAAILGVSLDELRPWILDVRTHNWTHDPFSRGAYSFAAAGLDEAPRKLAQPEQNTLFFAGEATAELEDLGTVHGALSSGLRAGREARIACDE